MTASTPPGFHFVMNLADVDVSNARVVRISAGLLRKRDLLAVFARGLDFPGHFGWNWDALEECLRDLAWIKHPRRILLIHEGLPFQPDWDNRATYLSILKEAVAAYQKSVELNRAFPEAHLGLGSATYWNGDKAAAMAEVEALRELKRKDEADALESWIKDKEAKKTSQSQTAAAAPAPEAPAPAKT